MSVCLMGCMARVGRGVLAKVLSHLWPSVHRLSCFYTRSFSETNHRLQMVTGLSRHPIARHPLRRPVEPDVMIVLALMLCSIGTRPRNSCFHDGGNRWREGTPRREQGSIVSPTCSQSSLMPSPQFRRLDNTTIHMLERFGLRCISRSPRCISHGD